MMIISIVYLFVLITLITKGGAMPQLPNGSVVRLGTKLKKEIEVTSISNAVLPVATVKASTGVVTGDFIVLTSSWFKGVYQAGKVTETSIEIIGIDTTNKDKFDTASFANGKLSVVEEWVEIPNITDVSTDGGDWQATQVQYLRDDHQTEYKTFRNATSQTFTHAHDNEDPVRNILIGLDSSGVDAPVRIYNPRARENRLYLAEIGFSPVPTMSVNNIETVSTACKMRGDMAIITIKA